MKREVIEIEEPVVCRAGSLGCWYVIERAEHSDTFQLVPTNYGSVALWYSGRISDADVEGTAEDMLGIATAIETGDSFSANRCAVSPRGADFVFHSPRNSRKYALVKREHALTLAKQIKELVK